MLEWYRVGWNHRQLMEETIMLVESALALVGRRAEVLIEGYRQFFIDARQYCVDAFVQLIDQRRVRHIDSESSNANSVTRETATA